MKDVDMIARVRREFFARGRTIKAIVQDLHISRNTVRKIVWSGETEFTYERVTSGFQRSGRGRTSSIS
jgi:orotate phosphoribosyltransferase-like protein